MSDQHDFGSPSKSPQLMDFPESGTKISLIDLAEVRYEGVFLSANKETSTITLGEVRTFGTENRATTRPVALSKDVMNFLIFQAQTIKDIVIIPFCTPIVCAADKLPQPTPQQQNAPQQMVQQQMSQARLDQQQQNIHDQQTLPVFVWGFSAMVNPWQMQTNSVNTQNHLRNISPEIPTSCHGLQAENQHGMQLIKQSKTQIHVDRMAQWPTGAQRLQEIHAGKLPVLWLTPQQREQLKAQRVHLSQAQLQYLSQQYYQQQGGEMPKMHQRHAEHPTQLSQTTHVNQIYPKMQSLHAGIVPRATETQASQENQPQPSLQQQSTDSTPVLVIQSNQLNIPWFGEGASENLVPFIQPNPPKISRIVQKAQVSELEETAVLSVNHLVNESIESKEPSEAAVFKQMTATNVQGTYSNQRSIIRGRANYANVVRYCSAAAPLDPALDKCHDNAPNAFAADYNFDEANKEFKRLITKDAVKGMPLDTRLAGQRDDVMQETRKGNGTCYDNKKSFFDNISYVSGPDEGKENVHENSNRPGGPAYKFMDGGQPRKGYLANRQNFKGRGQLRTYNGQSNFFLHDFDEEH